MVSCDFCEHEIEIDDFAKGSFTAGHNQNWRHKFVERLSLKVKVFLLGAARNLILEEFSRTGQQLPSFSKVFRN